MNVRYPRAQRLDLVEDLHGRLVADPYRWLEDPDAPVTRTWSAAQADLFRHERDGWLDRAAIGARLAELARSDTMTLPRHRGGRTFFANRGAGQEHAVLTVIKADGSSRALLSPMKIDPSGSTSLAAWHPSIEGDLVAYQLGGGGTEESLLCVMDVDRGRIVDGPIDRVRNSMVAWLPGGAGFFYVRRLHPDLVPPGERRYHRRVYLHRIGADPSTDILIFGEGRDKADFYAVSLSVDGRWLRINATAGTARRTDIWLADLSGTGPQRPDLRMVQGGVDARTIPYIRPGTDPGRKVLLLTDRDAPRGRVATTALSDMDKGEWPDLVGEDPAAVLTLEPDPELVDDVVGWTTYASDLGFIISRPRPTQPCRTCTYRDGRLGAVANADGILYSCWETARKPGWEVGTAGAGYLPAGEVDGRWVGCGYAARNSSPQAAAKFRDAVDTRVLDYLHTMGRLGLRPVRR